MSFSDSRHDTVPVQLPNGVTVKFEVTQTGREDVSFAPNLNGFPHRVWQVNAGLALLDRLWLDHVDQMPAALYATGNENHHT